MADTSKTISLLDTNIGINPSGVFYNIENTTIEEFVTDYLRRKNVKGISKVKLLVKSEGKTNPNVVIYLFLNKNSNVFVNDQNEVLDILKDKYEEKVGVEISEDARKTLYPLCGNKISSGVARNGESYIKLNIFRVVGLMLAFNPNCQSLVITDAVRLRDNAGGSLISVVKSEHYSYSNGGYSDNYTRQIELLEKGH